MGAFVYSIVCVEFVCVCVWVCVCVFMHVCFGVFARTFDLHDCVCVAFCLGMRLVLHVSRCVSLSRLVFVCVWLCVWV